MRLLFHHQPTSGTRVLSGTAVHVAAIGLLLLFARMVPESVYRAVLPQRLPEKLVWLAQGGPGGGGGGGNKNPEPPPRAQLKGQQQLSVPAATPQPTTQPDQIVEPPNEPIAISAQPLAAATQVTFGDLTAGAASRTNSRGPGDGSGVGDDAGPGIGRGPGGPGDGPLQAGNGVLAPRIRRAVDPQYTPDAMRAKVQGAVLLAAVVQPDGTVTDIRVIRSLDRVFGLDAKAIEAARQWEFFPGTRQGQPVPVLVNIELVFNLR